MKLRYYWGLIAMVIFVSGCGATATVFPTQSTQSTDSPFESQVNEEGMVSIEITPINLLEQGATWDFNVDLETHSVDLSQDLMEVSVLVDGQGNEYVPLAWEGSEPGGHHREGVLKFASLLEEELQVDLRLRTIGDVSERVFVWEFLKP